MYKLSICLTAAAVLTLTQPGLAQQSTAASREARQTDVKSGTMHDHIERAEKIVKDLLEQRPAGATDPAATPKSYVNIERSQLEKLQGELNALGTASNSTSSASANTLQTHVTAAQNIVGSLETRTTANSDVVSVDRSTVKELRDTIEAIEHSSKDKSGHNTK